MNSKDSRTMADRKGGRTAIVNRVIALVAIAMFAVTGSAVLPGVMGLPGADWVVGQPMIIAFLLNIALVLFAWRRSAEMQRDRDARIVAEQRAYDLTYLDDTSGLFNRRYLLEHLNERCDAGKQPLALLLLDLDHFKKVNDLYGHSAGDILLRAAADLIRRSVPEGCCCARLGGDEFAVTIEGDSAQEDAVSAIAQHLLVELSRPIPLGQTVATISASVGVAKLDASCTRAEDLLRHSDIAMYEAKKLGRNCFVWFDTEMERAVDERNAIEAEMRIGLAEGQFVPFFQPLIDLQSGELKGFEVLARWQHPAKGIVEPNIFIPIAERAGLISSLSFAVMREALIEARTWPEKLTIAVNLSPVQFKDPLLSQRIVKLLNETGFPAGRLELEITESSLMEDQSVALATVESLKNHGIRMSLDDFGTGYASLTQLRSLPFDRIKIDRSFISSILDDEQSNAIVSAIATLGRSLQLPITAEGVESNGVQDRLQELGCSDGQGWLYGRAVSASDARDLFELAPEARLDELQAKREEAVAVPITQDRRSLRQRGSNG